MTLSGRLSISAENACSPSLDRRARRLSASSRVSSSIAQGRAHLDLRQGDMVEARGDVSLDAEGLDAELGIALALRVLDRDNVQHAVHGAVGRCRRRAVERVGITAA
jgi:adhesin HecA-like repeat protein